MATEADFPEAISFSKGEGEDRYLTNEQFDRNVEQCSPLELNKSKGELDQHHEIEKPIDSENVKVDCSTLVESKNNSFGISEGEHFLAPLSEISQAEQSNQAGMEIAKTEDAKLQVERVEASKNEAMVDQHVQAVISNQHDSTKEMLQRLENEAETSEVDVKGTEKADGNAESCRKEASGLLEANTFQEYEASISTLDFTNNSLKKDIEMETNVDNTSSTNPIFQEEFKEETSTKVTSNIEDNSQQTMHKYEPEEGLQKFPEVMPENAKTESASENAEVITSTDEERAIQNTKEYSEKEEANPVHGTEKEFEATRIEKVTGEHALPKIHTAEDHPQEFDEENSTNLQACVEAANLSANTEEKNLVEEVIQEKCSSLVEEQTTGNISREEEIHVTDLKEEEKEADAKYEEPIEVADTTREIEFETIEQRTETNKDLYVPIPEEEAYAEESTKAFVQNTTFLSEVSEIKTKEIIQEDLPTATNYGLVSGEVSHVSGSKEAETKNKEHVEILTDATALETEDHAQAVESFNSKENMEKEIQSAEDEGKRDVKETSIVLEEKGLETILTDQTALQTEDVELQAEENVDSKDILEKQIPTAADEGENGLMEAQAENNEKVTDTDITTVERGLATIVTDEGDTGLKEAEEANKEQVKIYDVSPEEKVLPTILTDETALDIEDIDVQAKKNSNSIENVEKQIPVIADEGLKEAEEENKEQVKINDNSPEEILTDEAALDNEEIELQAEENVNSKDNSEKQIPTVADEGEICLVKAEAENNEQVTITDITPEEKGLATISTDEKALHTENIDVQAEESFNSEEKLEELIPTTEVRNTEISPEEKDLVTIIANETSLDIQDPAVQEEETSNSKEDLEKQISEAPDKGGACVKEAGEENKEQVKNTYVSPEEKGQETILIDETTTHDKEYIDVQAGENFISKEILEIPKAVDEDETDLTEAEAENKEHVETTEKGPEEKGLATILTDETAEDIEYNDAQAAEINSKEVLEKQIPTAVDEGETDLAEAEADYKEHVETTEKGPEEKGLATALTDETAEDIEYNDAQAAEIDSKEVLEKQIPTAVDEGETDLAEAEADYKEHVEYTDIAPEQKGVETILTDETAEDIEYNDAQAAEIDSNEVLEKQIPTAVDEGETDLTEAEADYKEHVEYTDIAPEQKGVETILRDEPALELEDVEQEQENFNSKENLENQIPTAVDEGEADLNRGEAENNEQVKNSDITVLRDEMALDIEDLQEKENQIPKEPSEGEEKVGHGDIVFDHTPVNVYSTELVGANTVEESFQVQSQEEAEQKLGVKDEKSEDHPERNDIIVEEPQLLQVLEEPKITSQDFKEEQMIGGNVTIFTPESIEEDMVKNSQDNEKEENANDLSPEYIPEDGSEMFKDDKNDAVKSEGEILEHSQNVGVEESTTCETKNVERSEEILSTLPVKYDQESSTAPKGALKEENIDEDTISVQAAKDNDGDNGAVTVTETCARAPSNDEEDSPQVLKYEPGEEITKLSDVLPEETIPESSNENAEVITCTKEAIQDSLDKESDTSTGEACKEAAELSTEGEKEKQTTQEVSSSLIGEETTEESSKEDENFVTSLQEEKNEEHEVCKEAIEAKSETLEETTEPKPISEEESNKLLVEDNSFLSEASEKEIEKEIQSECSCTQRNFDSEVVSEETGLSDATSENKEQVETTHIAPEEKDNADTGVYNTELVGEMIVEPNFQVQPLEEEEAEPKLEVEDGTDKSDDHPEKNNKILEEVLDEPKITDRDFNVEQITEGNVVNFAPESIVEETVTNYQDDKKETEKLKEEGSSIENIKEGNANDISTECVLEDRGEKLEECIGEAVESKEEILQESQTDGSGEITARDTTGVEKTEEETSLQNEEPREVKVSNLALEKIDSDATEEETTGGSEVVPESDSKSIDVVTKDEVIADQTLDEGISKEPSTLLVEEKELSASEHEPETTSQDKSIEEEHAKEVEVPTADGTGDLLAPRSAEETCLPKEEPRGLRVTELALEKLEAGESEEEIKETFETVSKFDSQSIGVVSKAEILEHTQTTTCEIKNVERYEEIVSTLPGKYDQRSSPAPTEASKEENIDENTFSVQEAKDSIDGDNGAVTVTETCAKITPNDEEDAPQVLEYEPGEEITKLPDMLPEEMSSNENAEVITCSKEEIRESLEKESDTSTGEVLETTSTETGEHAFLEVNHPQGFNDKETTEGNATEYQACNEAAELSTEGEKEKQTTQEVSSTLMGEETTEESSKDEENFVRSLQEEKNEEHEVCKEAIEAKSETLEDTTEPKPISEEESNKSIVEDNSFLSEASEIQGEYSSTVRHFDSEVVSNETGLTEATAENKEQVETTHIVPEEKDNAGTCVYNSELVGETIVEPSFQVKPLEEEAELKLEVEDETDKSDGPEKNNKILEEVLHEPKITDRDFNEEQIAEGNIVNFAAESIVEETLTNYQDDEKEAEKLNEEGSSIETIKESNANDISTECVPENRDEKLEECIGEAVESKEEILQESQTDGLGEITTCDTSGAEKTYSDAPEEESTGGSEVVLESDSKSIDVVTKEEIIADQTLDEGISKEPSTLLAEEKELTASEHEHETTSQDKNIEEEHAKEVEVPTADGTGDLLAPRSVEETCLPKEVPTEKVSELALEKLEAGESKEEIKETFETVSKFDSQSIGVVSEEEIIIDQTQCECKTDAPLQIPSYTLLPEEKDLKASEVVQETVDADTPEEEIRDGSAMVPKFDSESIDDVLKDDIISDQTLQEGLSTEQLQTPSSALLPEEKELGASEHEHETTTVDKNLYDENPKEVEVPADEDKKDLCAATPAKETCLQAEEPKDSELALQNLDAGEIEEEIEGTFETDCKSDSQSIVVASGDDILDDQALCEGITDPPISKDREFVATELALEKLDAEHSEEIKVPEIVTKFDSESTEIVSNNEFTADQAFSNRITKEQIQSPSSTLLPEEKERETSEPEHETTAQDKNTEQECTKEVEVSADEDTQSLFAAGPVEEKSLQKEEPSELNVSELAQEKLDAGDTEEANETFETVSKPDFPSTVAVSGEEITVDETLSKEVTDIPLEIPCYTSLHVEKELKASELNLEKVDADIPEEEIKEGSEVIPQSNSQSTCEVSKDEIIADQLQIPSSALVPDEKEFKASEHEYETTTDDKNIEDENLKEVEEPTDEATQDLFAARSEVESCLQKEKPSELKVPELALEKLGADETEEVEETFGTVSKSDSESIYAVSKNELTDEHSVCDVITDMPLHIASYTSLTKENELNASELALEKLDANATEEVKEGSEVTPKSDLQSIDVVVRDEIIADQVLHEVITKDQLPIQSSILLPEEKELKESEHEHGTATQYKNLEEEYAEEIEVTADEDTRDLFVASSEEKTQLQKEEPRELKVSELAPENLDVGETEEEITTQNFERVSKPDPESTDAVSKDESIAEQTLHQSDEQLQIASPTLLPKEKEEATVQKEEPEDSRVQELALKELNAGETEEETKEEFETVPEFSSQSIGELATDETVDQIPPSSLLTAEKRCENTTTIDKAEEKSMNVVETPNDESRKGTNIAEETGIPNEEPRELNLSDLEFHLSQDTQRDTSNEVHEEEGCSLKEVPKVEPREDEEKEACVDSNEAKKNEASNEERNLELATSDSRAEDWCETTIEANETAKIEVPNEEIKDEKEVAKDSQLIYVGEENIRASQQENESREEKYPEEKNETFKTAPSEKHHEVTNPMEKDSSVEISQEGILGFEEAYGNTRDIKQLEKEYHATNIPSSNEAALNFLQDPTLEDTKPSNDTLAATETKEEKVSESGVETADSTSAQISERLVNESTEERMKVITQLTEEKEPTVSKELQADKEEEDEEEHGNVEEAKTDEEKEDTEHKRTYQGYDEPVIVEASTDTEVKVKKSHNILSGMGSKVKHSISKVKKAIIGKSSNSKTQSEK